MHVVLNRILFLSTLLLCLHTTSAQNKSYKKGYIIQHRGDTLMGFVKDRSPEPFVSFYKKIRFKQRSSSRVKKYDADDILGYGYGAANFLSVPFREQRDMWVARYYTDLGAPREFLKVIAQSENLIYYEQLFIDDDNSYLDSVPFFHKPSSNQMVRVTQGILGFKKKRLMEYFSDCPEIISFLNTKNPRNSGILDVYEFYLANCAE
nr:hypothetical protein [uncultured Allomuricauda sp.]